MFTLFYGFSADPVHQGHIDLVTAAVAELAGRGYAIPLVLLVPVYRRNPVGEQPKQGLPETYQYRVRMAELAAGVMSERLAGTGCAVKVSRAARELAERSGGPNYDLETLRYIKDHLEPGGELLGSRVRALAQAARDSQAGDRGDRAAAGIPAEHGFPRVADRGGGAFHLPAWRCHR